MDVKPGSSTTEWLMAKRAQAISLLMVAAGFLAQFQNLIEVQGEEIIMTVGSLIAIASELIYTASRTVVKTSAQAREAISE